MQSSTRALLDIIEAGARVPTIIGLTGLSASKAREFWRLQNCLPPVGRYPSLRQLTKTKTGHAITSILAQHILSFKKDGVSAVEVIYNTYITHKTIFPDSPATVDHVFIIWRELSSNKIQLVRCHTCHGMVLKTDRTKKCCFCRKPLGDHHV